MRALFLSSAGEVQPDSVICSGCLPPHLGGQPCPYSENGRMPAPIPLAAEVPGYSIDQGLPGELCPPCAKQQLSCLGHWQGHGGCQWPEALLPLRLFKCRQGLWLVVPGLLNEHPTIMQEANHGEMQD